MLMRCLDEGGIPVHRDHTRDARPPAHNPDGFYEPPHGLDPDAVPDGHAIKMFVTSTDMLRGTRPQWNVALIRRNPADVLASHERLTGRPLRRSVGTHGLAVTDFSPSGYERLMGWAVQTLRTLGVTSIVELQYEDICANPTATLGRLVEAGWPLDLDAAAAVPR